MAKEKTREQDILEAATRIFDKKGFHGASIGEIAEEAGIGKGTTYEYFRNKDELFIRVLEFNIERYLKELRRCIQGKSGFYEKLGAFIDFHDSIIRQRLRTAETMLLMHLGMASLNPETMEAVKLLAWELRKRIVFELNDIWEEGIREKLIEDDLDFSFVSDSFMNMTAGCCVRALNAVSDQYDFRQERQKLISLLMNGIGKKGHP
ncbi:MAG: TetR/AcrR family transcriptional regulator [Clostridia bacterium]|jgi:AcrR family transcriptional regulator